MQTFNATQKAALGRRRSSGDGIDPRKSRNRRDARRYACSRHAPRLRALIHVYLLPRSARKMSAEITTVAKSVMATAQAKHVFIMFVFISFVFIMQVSTAFVFIAFHVRTQIGKFASAENDLLDMIRSRRGSDRPRLNGKPRQIRRAAHI